MAGDKWQAAGGAGVEEWPRPDPDRPFLRYGALVRWFEALGLSRKVCDAMIAEGRFEVRYFGKPRAEGGRAHYVTASVEKALRGEAWRGGDLE